MMSVRKKFFQYLKLFLFPLKPLKVFSSIRLMTVLAFLLGLRFALQYATVYIPSASMSISISWTPLIVIGWVFGPAIGLVSGFVTDTVAYLIKPGSIWFWMYAIQEPLVGLLSGVIGSICFFRIKNIFNQNFFKNSFSKIMKKKNFFYDLAIQQLIFIIFLVLCGFTLISWVDETSAFELKSIVSNYFYFASKYIILGGLILFFVIVELLTIWIYFKNKKNLILCCWILILVILNSIIFSFIMGPIAASSYYEYLYQKPSPSFIKYGAIFYLIPRIIKESIKVPIQSLILLSVLPLTFNTLYEIKNNVRLKWKENLKFSKEYNFFIFKQHNKKKNSDLVSETD